MGIELISLFINMLEVKSICQATATHSGTHQPVSVGRTNLGIYETVVTYYHHIWNALFMYAIGKKKTMSRPTSAHDSQTSHAVASAGVDAEAQAGATAVTMEIA
ncbi:hypothetical protein [Pseudomonas sp. PGPR40]|uniref:hypothetical protein n=1 Tax=Pseudomonas sp. PGPR40 TaxID=2913476 RepID=UPI001EDB6BB9|nr:hypothetical protein [Pseudomonas sp. PGPR40]